MTHVMQRFACCKSAESIAEMACNNTLRKLLTYHKLCMADLVKFV